MNELVSKTIEEEKEGKPDEGEKIQKIEFKKEERIEIIENSQILKEILQKDNGSYILSCLETIRDDNIEKQMFENLVKSLRYRYPHNVINLILLPLINPPFVAYELKEIIKDDEVNKFIDDIYQKYSYRISKLHKILSGERDWQYITSNPIVKDSGIVLAVDVTLANGENFSFTSPLRALPIMSYHFLKHMNKTIDFFKERAIDEIPIEQIYKINKEMEKLLDRFEEHNTKKSEEATIEENDSNQEIKS